MFTMDGEFEITDTPVKDKSASDFPTWMYEEWDIDRRQRCCFSVLLSDG
jgi:hypothetical protein